MPEFDSAHRFRDRCHIDLSTRAANRGMKPLDVCEEMGRLEDLYEIAVDLLQVRSEAKKAWASIKVDKSRTRRSPSGERGLVNSQIYNASRD